MVKNKIWSIISVVIAIICFCLSLFSFFYAAIAGRTSLSAVSTTCYILTIVGIVIGIVALYCGSKRTEWKVNMVAGFGNLTKIGLMLNIIVLAATLMA